MSPRIVDGFVGMLDPFIFLVVWLADGDVQRSQFARLLIPGDVGGVAVVRQQVEGRPGAADVPRHRARHQDIPRRTERRRKSSRSRRSHRVISSVLFSSICAARWRWLPLSANLCLFATDICISNQLN